ncbi:MAG: GNAT family N-acetyltransferase, partial [Acidobacteriota bacterium]
MTEPWKAGGGDVFLETPRLSLRRFRAGDADSFAAYRADPEVARYQGWDSCTRGDAVAFIEAQLARAPFEPGRWTQVAVELSGEGTHIGDCALRMESPASRQAEMGFTFARGYQGRGFATEAVSHLLGFAFARLGMHRVFAVADARNLRAIALVERVGMRREGEFVDAEWFKGEWVSTVVYAQLETEFRAP